MANHITDFQPQIDLFVLWLVSSDSNAAAIHITTSSFISDLPWGSKIGLATSIWASSWMALSMTLEIVNVGGNWPLITTFLTKEWEFGLLLVNGWDKVYFKSRNIVKLRFYWDVSPCIATLHSQLQIFEYLTMNHGFDLNKPVEMYGSTNPRFDIKYSNIRSWTNQNALHWSYQCHSLAEERMRFFNNDWNYIWSSLATEIIDPDH